jgi:hypothetical protein
MEDVTAVLITREVEYPNIVLERLNCTDFFKDIIIVTECPSVYHRYLAAAKAETEHIFVLDDDALVNFQVLWSKYDKDRITNTMTLPFVEKYKDTGCTLVGWGCYFPKSMLSVFDRYIEKYGVDAHLLREADRIFTYLNKPWNTVIQPHEDLEQTSDRMGYQPEHYTSMNEALEKCKNLD